MKRADLEHVIRAAAAITGEEEFVILGSQAILGSAPSAPLLAPELCMSVEADIYPRARPELADAIEGALGRNSDFHDLHGYYADGVGPETAILPRGWEERLVAIDNTNTGGGRGYCLEPHDLAIAKLAALREKDREFVAALLRHGLANIETLRHRLSMTALAPGSRAAIEHWLAGRSLAKGKG